MDLQDAMVLAEVTGKQLKPHLIFAIEAIILLKNDECRKRLEAILQEDFIARFLNFLESEQTERRSLDDVPKEEAECSKSEDNLH